MRSDKTDEIVADLLDTARPPYAARERALSAMAGARAERPARSVSRRTSWILRGAAAAVVVALGLGLVVIPGRHGRRDVQAILAGVAHAMATADSVLCEFRQTDAGLALSEEFVGGLPVPYSAVELEYFGPDALYTRRTRADGVITWAEGLDLGARQWWHYYRDVGAEGTLWVADLTLVEADVADYLSRPIEERATGGLPWALAGYLEDEQVEVTSAIDDDRKLTLVTFTGRGTARPLDGSPSRFLARNVLEVEPATGRLLNARYYCQFGDEPEQLVAVFTAEYDIAMPAYMAAKPDAAEVVEATVSLEDRLLDGREVTFLTMRAGGSEVLARTAPAVPETGSVFKAGEGRPELDQVMSNVQNVGIAIQMFLADHDGKFPPVDNVHDLMPLLDEYLRSRHVFMRPGTEDEVVVKYLVPAGLDARELADTGGTPVAVADYHPDFAVVAYADGHTAASDKKSPSYKDRWWEAWWREFELER